MPLILIIEDSIILRRLYQEILSSEFEVHFAEDGEQGWKIASTGRYDMVLIDFNLPGMDGLTLVRKLRSLAYYAEIPILIVSANGQSFSTTTQPDISGWVVKPIHPQSFAKGISKLLTAYQYKKTPQSVNTDSLQEQLAIV